jgi:nucleotide-binding universal stress UspA family protein
MNTLLIHLFSSPLYRIVVAADDSPISKKAIDHAIKLCSKLTVPYKLDIVYAMGLNPAGITAFGFM